MNEAKARARKTSTAKGGIMAGQYGMFIVHHSTKPNKTPGVGTHRRRRRVPTADESPSEFIR
jgi:hypothetical protein